MNATTPAAAPNRLIHVFLTLVIAMAFVGFVVGLRQGKTSPLSTSTTTRQPASHIASTARVVESTPWAQFDRRTHGPNARIVQSISTLRQPEVDLFAESTWSEAQRVELLAARAQRRAYDGAPPVIPHPIDQMSASSCVACHGSGLFIAGAYAPPMSHHFMPNCTQCHVEQHSSGLETFLFAESNFIPLEAPLTGSRAWAGAPPTLPHPTHMRENCMACHGPIGPQAIRSTHPWRTNCLQCHAPSAELDQSAARLPASFLSPPSLLQP